MSSAAPAHLLSRDEECCLKTALAFVILRNRLENDEKNLDPPAFVRGLMSCKIPTLPVDQTSHMDKMMQVAVSTALPLCQKLTNAVDSADASAAGSSAHAASTATLDGIATHLALQLCDSSSDTKEWIQASLQSSSDILATCTVWHRILMAEPSIGANLLPAIGRVLQSIYNEEEPRVDDPSVWMVNLLELVEASISMRLDETNAQQLLLELSQAMGPELCLPVPVQDMAYFVLQEKRSGGRNMLLRFGLYGLMERLAACL